MSPLDPILDDLRTRLGRPEITEQERGAIARAVAEAAALLDDELDRAVAGMTVRMITDPTIAANSDVRTLLWHACGRSLLAGGASEQRPILVRPIVPEGYLGAYDAEVARLAPLVAEVLTRRL